MFFQTRSELESLFSLLPTKIPTAATVSFNRLPERISGYLYKYDNEVFFLHDCPERNGTRPGSNKKPIPSVRYSWYLFRVNSVGYLSNIDSHFINIEKLSKNLIGEL